MVAEYRELGRRELARRLQQLAAQTGELFPPAPTPTPPADAADGTGRDSTDPRLRARPADAAMVLPAAASVGADAASKNDARTGDEAVLHGGGRLS